MRLSGQEDGGRWGDLDRWNLARGLLSDLYDNLS